MAIPAVKGISTSSESLLPQPPLWISCQDQSIKIPLYIAVRVEKIAMMLTAGATETPDSSVKYLLCEKFPALVFKATVLLLTEDKPWDETLTPEQQSDPYIVNELHKCVSYLYPSRVHYLTLKYISLLSLMPLTTARQLLDNWGGVPLEAPFLATKRVKQSIYFPDDGAAELHFQKESACQSKLFMLKEKRFKIEGELQATKSDEEKALLHTKQKKLHGAINLEKLQCRELKKSFDPKNLTMMQHYYASRHIMHRDILISTKAARSVEIIGNYRKNILEILKKSKANLARNDLLDYLVGPKAFLFDYYGIFPDENIISFVNRRYPFTCMGSVSIEHSGGKELLILNSRTSPSFGYQLDNLGPYELEDEIRHDLQHHIPLERMPPRLIQENVITQLVTPELRTLQEEVRPALLQWALLKQTERDDIIAKILQYNGWDSYKIYPSDIDLTIKELPSDTDMHRFTATGFLLVNYERWNLRFNTFNFLLLITSNNYCTYPDSCSNHNILNEIYKRTTSKRPVYTPASGFFVGVMNTLKSYLPR